MRYWTYSEIKEKIQADLGIQDELFVEPEELLAYVNEAIDEAEAEIHTLYENYFLARTPLTLVSGTEGYAMPSNIYGDKIVRILYRNGTLAHKITQIPQEKALERYTDLLLETTSGNPQYQYFLENTTAGSPQIVLVPTPNESGAYVTVWYLRNANRLVEDSDVCDIPEFVSFVLQYVKVRVYEKEGHENLLMAIQALQQQRDQMNATLRSRTASGENEIHADMSFYKEHL